MKTLFNIFAVILLFAACEKETIIKEEPRSYSVDFFVMDGDKVLKIRHEPSVLITDTAKFDGYDLTIKVKWSEYDSVQMYMAYGCKYRANWSDDVNGFEIVKVN